MHSSAGGLSVRRAITLQVSTERAFTVFTEQMGRWWPIETTMSHAVFGESGAYSNVVVEPRAGGRWLERTADGQEFAWGHVAAYDPPRRLVLTLSPSPNGDPVPDESTSSQIEMRFMSRDVDATEVVVEYRGGRHHGRDVGAAWQREMESPAGWDRLLDRLAIASTPDGTDSVGAHAAMKVRDGDY